MRQKYLEAEIERHNKLFFEEHTFEISDPEYDLLVEELRAINPGHPLVSKLAEAPGSVVHPEPLLSLGKCYTPAELLKWAEGVARSHSERFGVSDKRDGCAARNEQEPIGLFSRGDGVSGEDWTSKLKVIKFPFGAAGRGEIVVTKTDFEQFRTETLRSDGSQYKNERAMAAGVLNTKTLPAGFPKVLTFVPYTHEEEVVTFEELFDIDWLASMTDAQAGPIPADGLVIRVLDRDHFDALGTTSHHPRGAIALKFKNPTGRTKLINVVWQCGKGRLSPVGEVEPCEISGTTITYCSLHNMDFINSLGLQIGDDIEITRHGDVIPGVTCVISQGKNRRAITCDACPACGSSVEDFCCTNSSCGGTATKKLLDALVRLGIETVGPTIANQLVTAGRTTIPQVFAMSPENWQALPGFATASALKMHKQFQNRLLEPIEDYRILAAMNIHGVGLSLSKKILAKLNLAELYSAGTDLEQLDNVGPGRAAAIREGFDEGFHAWAVFNMNIVATKGLADRPLICFTGAGPLSRSEYIALAEKKGYAYKNAVTKNLAVLVASRSDTTKAKKAASYGVQVITYPEFATQIAHSEP